MKRILTAVALLLISTSAYADRYSLVVTTWPANEVFVIADQKGFYKKEGVAVDLKYFTVFPDWFKAIASNRFDFIPIWFSTLMGLHLDNNAKHIAVGTTMDCLGPAAIVSTKDSAQKGMRIGMTAPILGFQHMFWRYLSDNNLKLSDVRQVILSADDLVNNFARKRIQSILVFGDYVNQAALKHDAVVWKYPEALPSPGLTIVALPRNKIDLIPQKDIQALLRAHIAAQKWILNPANEAEFRDIVLRYFAGSQMENLFKTDKAFANYKQNYRPRYFITTDDLSFYSKKGLEAYFHEALAVRKQSQLSYDLNFREMVDNSALDVVLSEMNRSE